MTVIMPGGGSKTHVTTTEEQELIEKLKAMVTAQSVKEKPQEQEKTVEKHEEEVVKVAKKQAQAHLDLLPAWFKLSKTGEQVKDELLGLIENSTPTLLLGGTGMGKTIILEMIAKILGRDSVGFNCYTGMDISQLIGIWRPNTDGTIVWQDGVLTAGIRKGAIIRIEEYTRAPSELKSRMFGILDSQNRSWNLFEAGIPHIEVPEQTTIVASANPTGNGYIGTMREDKASMSRFGAILQVDEPLADENHAIMSTLKDKDMTERIVRFAEFLRKDNKTYLSTRDLHFFALALKRGLTPHRATEVVIIPKYEGNESSILTHARAVFEEAGDLPTIEEHVNDNEKEVS